MRRLMRLVATLGALAVMWAAQPAHADVVGGGDDSVKYMRISGGNGGGGSNGGGGGSDCEWRLAQTANFHFNGGSPYTGPEIGDMLDDTEGTWYSIYCNPSLTSYGWLNVYVANGTPAADPFAMADELYKYLKAPSLPTRVNPDGSVPVKLPVWFWIDEGDWASTVTVTGTVAEGTPAFQAASLTAKPGSVVWNTGEGLVACDGPGEAWTAGTDPMAASGCSKVYEHAADQRNVSARVSWPVVFRAWGVVDFTIDADPIFSNSPAVPLQVLQVETFNR